ncbi:MBL fold metallo-hydrolase [Saccharicrinis sp. FJH54]|uniref:MBL fold metallo-hydrolase n=1 Tax=Saccharicrinis sp. FJH54 TaxID=3344665 RepID=UPI0035D445CD
MVEICAIASGSNGNCYYVGNGTDAVLVDVGISRKQVLLRMEAMGLDKHKVRAIFISHEHADHMRGVKVLSKVLDIPVYLTKKTYESSWNPNRPGKYAFFEPDQPVSIGSVTVHPFLKNHDAIEPCSFRIEINGKQVGVFTDIGEPCDNMISHFKQCDAMFLETNYDEEMLWNGPYPYYLKQRVASSNGHLSNFQALTLLQEHAGSNLNHVLLSHLSQENNTPELAVKTFEKVNARYNIQLTSRVEASKVFTL